MVYTEARLSRMLWVRTCRRPGLSLLNMNVEDDEVKEGRR
jgi:hypothetical protein